jgi:hypothetical protein
VASRDPSSEPCVPGAVAGHGAPSPIPEAPLEASPRHPRRDILAGAGTALPGIALAALLGRDGLLAAGPAGIDPARPFAPRPGHFPARARNVLVIFCAGAVSQLETWDWKPQLVEWDGRPLPGGPAVTFQGPAGNLARPQYAFRPRGATGKMVSDLVPHLAALTDEIAFVHSLTSRTNTHGPAENFLSTGFVADGFPSLGSWVTYALGSDNENLPAFVAIPDPRGIPQASGNNWGSGFLPAEYQGTTWSSTAPIRHLATPAAVPAAADRAGRALLGRLNRRHAEAHPADTALTARIAAYELAARMQLAAPALADLSTESAATRAAYGADDADPIKAGFARNCILARRLIEQGVRFVQLFNGAYASGGELNWDGHTKLKQQYDRHAAILDQPAAALIRDLRARGLLDETLVVWCTEFGRMPYFQKGAQGRDHNPDGFTCWMTGAGVKPGVSVGRTDDFGAKAVEDVHPLYDFNATILHLLGIDHERLTFRHNGVERRLTDVHGRVIRGLLA